MTLPETVCCERLVRNLETFKFHYPEIIIMNVILIIHIHLNNKF